MTISSGSCRIGLKAEAVVVGWLRSTQCLQTCYLSTSCLLTTTSPCLPACLLGCRCLRLQFVAVSDDAVGVEEGWSGAVAAGITLSDDSDDGSSRQQYKISRPAESQRLRGQLSTLSRLMLCRLLCTAEVDAIVQYRLYSLVPCYCLFRSLSRNSSHMIHSVHSINFISSIQATHTQQHNATTVYRTSCPAALASKHIISICRRVTGFRPPHRSTHSPLTRQARSADATRPATTATTSHFPPHQPMLVHSTRSAYYCLPALLSVCM